MRNGGSQERLFSISSPARPPSINGRVGRRRYASARPSAWFGRHCRLSRDVGFAKSGARPYRSTRFADDNSLAGSLVFAYER
jgi:hypothetical protein